MIKETIILTFVCMFSFFPAGCIVPEGKHRYVAEGNKYYEADKYDNALLAYSHAIQENPGSIEAHFKRGIIFQKRQNFDLAIQEYNETIRIDMSHPKAHFNLGLIYSYEMVDYIKAIYFMEQFINLAPEHVYVPEARSRIVVMKKKAYGDEYSEEGNDSKSLLDLTDEFSEGRR